MVSHHQPRRFGTACSRKLPCNLDDNINRHTHRNSDVALFGGENCNRVPSRNGRFNKRREGTAKHRKERRFTENHQQDYQCEKQKPCKRSNHEELFA